MVSRDDRRRAAPTRADDAAWAAQWALVPEQWRRPVYRIHEPPADAVFKRNRYYLSEYRGADEHDFTPVGAPRRFADEIAWWVWVCQHEGLRRIEPSMLRWAAGALSAAAADYRTEYGWVPTSIADLPAEAIVRLFDPRDQPALAAALAVDDQVLEAL